MTGLVKRKWQNLTQSTDRQRFSTGDNIGDLYICAKFGAN